MSASHPSMRFFELSQKADPDSGELHATLLPPGTRGYRDLLGLARVASRAVDTVNWDRVVELARKRPAGAAALRRLAATLNLLDIEVPAPLATRRPPMPPTCISASDDCTAPAVRA